MTAPRLILGMALLVFAGCGRSEPPADNEKRVGSTTSAVSTPVWEFEGGGYSFNCFDECGVLNCNCVGNRCNGNPEGQACSVVGDECNVVSGRSSYRTLECEPPDDSPPPVTTWTRISTDSCADACGATNCNCVGNRCSGNPEGELCSSPGAACNVVDGPSIIELSCQ
jgi:hypothetical protein